MRARTAALGMLLALAAPAQAERLITTLSTSRVLISSNFTGADVVLFGSVERDAQTVARRGGYDIVITVTGPRETVVTYRKERVAGVWVNADSRTFVKAPSYLTVLSNRTINDIADINTLRRTQTGLARTLLPQEISGDIADSTRDDPFRQAFLRLKIERGLYREIQNGVTFLTPALYRAAIPIPDNAPTGSYEVDVKLFADGALLARQQTALEIVKVGFEQFVAAAAREHGLFYGLATALMALLTGWLASVVFRKD
ncbi:MAG: TIGR02186 family protein [Alphaproteobacteria bacterium]|nr:MAG: TIGR02186 family protein [Alphaproteobacteria bacterium]